MLTLFSKLNVKLYSSITRPVLFKFPADFVHEVVSRVGTITQSIPFALRAIKFLFAFNDNRLNQTIAGIKFVNPIGLSAGFDKEVRLPKLMHSLGFGFTEVGSVTAKPYVGNKKPWYRRLPHTKSILVNSGLRSSGIKNVSGRADKLLRNKHENMIINVSVAKTNSSACNTVDKAISDYCESFKRLEKSQWPKLYTINISCPNTEGGEPFNQPLNLSKLLKAIDDLQLTRPVFLKLPINLPWNHAKRLVDVAQDSTVTGLTIGNLSKDRSLVHQKDKLIDNQKGNLSGKPCWLASNELLARCYTTYGKRFIYSGVGGVFSAEDAYTKIRLGATLVEVITGMIYGGPAIIGQINKGITELLVRDGYKNISEAVGVDSKKYIKELR